jgi:hypothetical protein
MVPEKTKVNNLAGLKTEKFIRTSAIAPKCDNDLTCFCCIQTQYVSNPQFLLPSEREHSVASI